MRKQEVSNRHKRYGKLSALALVAFCLGLATAPGASAAELPYALEPRLSLTGNCDTSAADPVPDPDCTGEPPAYPPPPDRPAGRFDGPVSVAVDDWGNLYVASRSNGGIEGRIDIFDSEGHFIGELEDPHGPWSIAVDGEGNLYVTEANEGSIDSEVVRYPPAIYKPATGEIEYDPAERFVLFEKFSYFGGLGIDRAVAADPADDRLYVSEGTQIGIYSSAKTGNALIDTIKPAGMISGKYVAVDAQRRLLYATTCKNVNENCVVLAMEADAPYAVLKEIGTVAGTKFASKEGKISIAVDEANGHLFAGDLASKDDIYEFERQPDGSYALVSKFEIPGGPIGNAGAQSAVANNQKAPDSEDENEQDNYRHLFVPVSVFTPTGNAYAFAPPSLAPPAIKAAAAINVGETEAELEARIDPNELETAYAIQYVSEAQFAIDGFESASVAAGGTIAATSPPKRVSAFIGGLVPGTAYRFRVVAENDLGSDQEEVLFATHSDAPTETGPCPNPGPRAGASAALPDCRAYELVTPADTNGHATRGPEAAGEYFGMLQASPAGEAVNFFIMSGALPGTEASGYFFGDPYLATRGADGWSTAHAGPTSTQADTPKAGGFSPDQGYSFWLAEGVGSALVGGQPASYLRYPDGHSEPIGRGSLGTDQFARGLLITEGGAHIVFRTHDPGGHKAKKLEPEAPEEGIVAIYDRTRDPVTGAEETHVVSLLPDGTAPSQDALYMGASADGEGIAFRLGTTLYLRVGNEATHQIGTPGATFAGASEGGERAFYLEGGNLKAYDTTTGETIVFADTAEPVIPVNVAPRGTRAYFVSESAVAGSGPNPNGAEPQLGGQNLYLSEGEGTPTFVATVTERDVEGEPSGAIGDHDGLGLWTETLSTNKLSFEPSRLTPDGGVFAFQSRANLDGYDPGAEPQVYRYDRAEGSLECVSCPPTAAPASGGAVLQSVGEPDSEIPLGSYGFVPALRADGERLFFESTEALVSSDVDGLRDVYEWEEEGVGSCTREGGCVYLISSPTSPSDEYLFGHSSDGDDVFFTSEDVLVAGDQATQSIYDARVGGGFMAPVPPGECLGEACQPAVVPPPAPPTSTQGLGNFPAQARKRRCPKGKRRVVRRGKAVCVKKKRPARKRKASKPRRASR